MVMYEGAVVESGLSACQAEEVHKGQQTLSLLAATLESLKQIGEVRAASAPK